MPLIGRARYRGNIGTLSLNEGQLVFTTVTGVLSKTERIIARIPLNSIIASSVEGGMIKKLVMEHIE